MRFTRTIVLYYYYMNFNRRNLIVSVLSQIKHLLAFNLNNIQILEDYGML